MERKCDVADNVNTQVLQLCTTVQNLSKYVFIYIPLFTFHHLLLLLFVFGSRYFSYQSLVTVPIGTLEESLLASRPQR